MSIYIVQIMFRKLIIVLVLFLLTGIGLETINAQTNIVEGGETTIGIAQEINIAQESIQDGAIVSYENQEYTLSNTEYDDDVFGVINFRPAVSIGNLDNENGVPIVTSGLVFVNVSNSNGDIEVGDLITTSETPGVGVKATDSGYVLGATLEEADFSDGDIAKVPIQLAIRFWINPETDISVSDRSVNRSLTDIFNLSSIAAEEQPVVVFRFVVAALVILTSFAIGFLTFGRVARNGIEAVGRNPLAGKLIGISVFFNVLITIAIVIAGLAISYLIITV